MRIMSFNTEACRNYYKRFIDFDIMAKAIDDCNPDIVGLNEIRDKGSHEDFDAQAKILSEKTEIENYFFAKAIDVLMYGENNPYGNALLSKYKIIEANVIPVPDPPQENRKGTRPYESRCLLKAKLENGLTVLVIHFGLNDDEQENAIKTVLDNLEDKKCILMGDFNVTPDNHLLDPIRERMIDTASVFSEEKLSHPSDNPNKKIDYIFVSKDIEVVSADIPPIDASDHRPHIADIKF